MKIRLKAANGQYLCAENGGGREVVANRNAGSAWETFNIKLTNNKDHLESADSIFIIANNGQYLCAEGGGGREVVANRDKASIWETFVIEKLNGSGEIRNGDQVCLKCHNGQYLCAEGGGGREIAANRNKAGAWETFILEIVNDEVKPINSELAKIEVELTRRYAGKARVNVNNKIPEQLQKLQSHLSVLKLMNVDTLSEIGMLRLDGNVIPTPGITSPKLEQLYVQEVPFGQAFRYEKRIGGLTAAAGKGKLLNNHKIIQRKTKSSSQEVFIDRGYIVADELYFADNTTIVLKNQIKSLVIIANKIVTGTDVTFTWERQVLGRPTKKVKLSKPATPDTLTVLNFEHEYGRGADGKPGDNGEVGYMPGFAPSVEIWTLELIGNPAFDLCGQNGGKGGDGQDGQDGGDGANGRPEQYDMFGIVKSGPGNGGHGGNGGKGGTGGLGGSGGAGGNFSLYTSEESIQQYIGNFYLTVDGGSGGEAGNPGLGGAGGKGGSVGKNKGTKDRHGGSAGNYGALGYYGKNGSAGSHGTLCIAEISEENFTDMLLKPGIATVSKTEVHAGDSITVTGSRFNRTDVVVINDVPCQTTYIGDTLLSFTVPELTGGYMGVHIRQKDGTCSNTIYLRVLPSILSVTSDFMVQGRFLPGKEALIIGGGFTEKSRVLLNDERMPDVTFIDAKTIKFIIKRPASTAENETGETVTVKVVHEDGYASNPVAIKLDTFRMMVLGDSIQWGQGLRESDKIHSLVQNGISAKYGNCKVYKMAGDVRAHSGAIIGVDENDDGSQYFGEIPSSFPTIMTQCKKETEQPETVDFILMDGGINDVNVRTILDPTISFDNIAYKTEKYCKEHMYLLLDEVTTRFPNAKVVVTGYYQILSHKSDPGFIEAYLIATGLLSGGVPDVGGAFVLDNVVIDKLIDNSRYFAEQSSLRLREAVERINHKLGEERVFLAVPPFTEDNSAFAADPWIYGINRDLSPQDDPTIAAERARQAKAAHLSFTDEAIAIRASCGHPNPKGAQKYAAEVIKYI